MLSKVIGMLCSPKSGGVQRCAVMISISSFILFGV